MNVDMKPKKSFPTGAVLFWAFVLLGGMGGVGALIQSQEGPLVDRALNGAEKARERIWNPEEAKRKDMEKAAKGIQDAELQSKALKEMLRGPGQSTDGLNDQRPRFIRRPTLDGLGGSSTFPSTLLDGSGLSPRPLGSRE